MFNGFKTYLAAVIMAVLPLATEKVAGINWVEILTQVGVPGDFIVPLAGIVAALVMAIMRYITQATTVKEAILQEPPVK